MQLLQDGKLLEIRTAQNDIYTPDSDHLILNIHFGIANQFSRNLSMNVRNGLRYKVMERKQYPRPAPIGFEGFGETRLRNIKPHPVEAPLVRKEFELAATGVYSLSQLAKLMEDEGLRTKKGKIVGKSHLYSKLIDPVYYGHFYFRGELCEGDYEPIISKGLFDLV
ncbi:MAG: hypothetical protein KatS3mg087_1272 [Patescibacteria group bacterium]|nr:MAG: hypothetical protein KatS3mg087_1272 [Patescibacteria group bacterium]